MIDTLKDTSVIVALIAAITGVIGYLIGGWGKKKAHDLETLQAAISVLQAEYERLTKEVDTLRDRSDVYLQELESERDYVFVLQQHIVERKPPPPPPRQDRDCS